MKKVIVNILGTSGYHFLLPLEGKFPIQTEALVEDEKVIPCVEIATKDLVEIGATFDHLGDIIENNQTWCFIVNRDVTIEEFIA